MNRKNKHGLCLVLALLAALMMLWPAGAGAQVTSGAAPSDLYKTHLAWQKKMGSGSGITMAAPTAPVYHDGYVYVCSGADHRLYKLNKDSGAAVAVSGAIDGDSGYAIHPVNVHDGYVYFTVQTIDEDGYHWTKIERARDEGDSLTLDQVWNEAGDSYEGQNLCPLTIAGGKVYTGTFENAGEPYGTYFCKDIDSGETTVLASGTETGGFYWAGAASVNGKVLFASDSGNVYQVSQEQPGTASVAASIGRTRSTPVVSGNDAYFVNAAGKLIRMTTGEATQPATETEFTMSAGSTNTPLLYGDNLFVGDEEGHIYAFSLTSGSHQILATAPGPVKGEMLLSTGNDGRLCLYATYNKKPGGLYYVDMDADSLTVEQSGVTFLPQHSEYCISQVTTDGEGTLYYKNDSLYVMAVKAGYNTAAISGFSVKARSYNSATLSWTGRDNVTGYNIYRRTGSGSYRKIADNYAGTAYVATGLTVGRKYYFRVRAKLQPGTAYTSYSTSKAMTTGLSKPRISTASGRKSVTVRLTKVSGAHGYVIYRATRKGGHYRKVKTTKSRRWTNKRLRRGKRYYYKAKAYRKVGSKRVYSSWSNISYRKAR
ncbi:MAG: PQQ-binding-like beta-propeller repeat protein [Anaerovoracaceae bacterium]|jgi:hypothetical protein